MSAHWKVFVGPILVRDVCFSIREGLLESGVLPGPRVTQKRWTPAADVEILTAARLFQSAICEPRPGPHQLLSLPHGRVAGGPSRATMGRSPMDEKGVCKFCAIVTRTHSRQELETDVCQWKDIIISQPTFSQYRLLNVVKAELTDPLRFFSLRTEERTTIPFPGSHFSSNEP